MIVYSGWMIWQTCGEYGEAEEYYEDLTQYIAVPTTAAEPTTETETVPEQELPVGEILWPEVDFEALMQVNSDVVAWLYLEGTTVNYPVVQSDDNSYYLRRLLDGTWNSSGSLLLDCGSKSDFSGENSIIYGHNMRNGSMFNTLGDYKQQEFYDEHPTILLLTPQGNHQVLLFLGYVSNVKDSAWKLDFTDGTYEAWLAEIAEKSCFESDVVPTASDRILTLSTCSYEFDNARFVLHGVIK